MAPGAVVTTLEQHRSAVLTERQHRLIRVSGCVETVKLKSMSFLVRRRGRPRFRRERRPRLSSIRPRWLWLWLVNLGLTALVEARSYQRPQSDQLALGTPASGSCSGVIHLFRLFS